MRIQEMWYACCTARDRASGPGKGVAQACSEDGVMLPRLLPMLAVPAAPFDSSEYSFEVKWDGIRALAAVEPGRLRLWGRERAEYTDRYPELDVLRRLPAETLLDGDAWRKIKLRLQGTCQRREIPTY